MSPGAGLPARVVLVGFMAAGKSTVGRLLARRTGQQFVDLDAVVEELAGRPIPEIFRDEGEERFRKLEARATRALDERTPVIVAVGGGWMARSELRGRWDDAVRVWLRVGPEEAVRRIGDEIGSRPLLDTGEPTEAARRLLERRRPDYGRAEIAVKTEGRTPEEVAGEVLRRLRAGTP